MTIRRVARSVAVEARFWASAFSLLMKSGHDIMRGKA
jgi:hypothetical protein